MASNPIDGEYLVVYANLFNGPTYDIAAQRVAGDGTLLSWANIATGGGAERKNPSVAFNPSLNQYLIAYEHESQTTPITTIRAKVAAADLLGVSIAPEIDLCPSAGSIKVAVGAVGDGYLAMWADNFQPWARRVASDGTPLGPATGFVVADTAGDSLWGTSRPNAVAGAEAVGYVVAWHEMLSLAGDVYARVVAPHRDGLLTHQLDVAVSPQHERDVAVACAPWGTCLVAHYRDANIVAHMVQLHIFGNGFESGDTSAWSTSIP